MSILQGKLSYAALFMSLNPDLVEVATGSQCTFYVPSIFVLSPETISIFLLCFLGGVLLSAWSNTVSAMLAHESHQRLIIWQKLPLVSTLGCIWTKWSKQWLRPAGLNQWSLELVSNCVSFHGSVVRLQIGGGPWDNLSSKMWSMLRSLRTPNLDYCQNLEPSSLQTDKLTKPPISVLAFWFLYSYPIKHVLCEGYCFPRSWCFDTEIFDGFASLKKTIPGSSKYEFAKSIIYYNMMWYIVHWVTYMIV